MHSSFGIVDPYLQKQYYYGHSTIQWNLWVTIYGCFMWPLNLGSDPNQYTNQHSAKQLVTYLTLKIHGSDDMTVVTS